RPDQPSLHIGAASWSYRELRKLKERIAVSLATLGLGEAEERVGVLALKGPVAFAGLLAAMASGNVYTPLNTKSPIERLKHVIDEQEMPALMVNQDSLPQSLKVLRQCLRGQSVHVLAVFPRPNCSAQFAIELVRPANISVADRRVNSRRHSATD